MENDKILLNNIKEKIAIENFKIERKNAKRRRQKIMAGILSSGMVFILCLFLLTNDEPSIRQDKNNEKDKLSIASTLEKIDQNKIIYSKQAPQASAMLIYEPTIENMYQHSDIVMIGTFCENLGTYTPGIGIYTVTKFDTIEVLKNETNKDITKSVVFSRMGGVMTLEEYMKDNITIRPDEFNDISEEERSSYYMIEAYAPDNRLDFTTKGEGKCLLFLGEEQGKLSSFAGYYGIREIQENQLYDYDTNEYISVENTEIKKAFTK